MIKLSATEADALLAEMRGWTLGKSWRNDIELFDDGTMRRSSHEMWNPTQRVEQARECLEAWCDKNECDAEMLRKFSLIVSEGAKWHVCLRHQYGKIASHGSHKDPSIAICTALASAILGEQVEIKL